MWWQRWLLAFPGLLSWAAFFLAMNLSTHGECPLSHDSSEVPVREGSCLSCPRCASVPEIILWLLLLRSTKPESWPLPYSRERGQFQTHLLERVPHKGLCYWKKLGGRKRGGTKTIITTAIPATFWNEVGNSLRYLNHGLSLFHATHSCLSNVVRGRILG